MKKFAWVLICLGFMLCLIPILGNLYTEYQQRQLQNQLESQLASMSGNTGDETPSPEDSFIELQESFQEQDPSTGSAQNTSLSENTPEPTQVPIQQSQTTASVPSARTTKKPSFTPLGRIVIEKIKVSCPIVEGVEPEKLKIAIGHLPGTAGLGQAGNCALAGHRSYTFGDFFNRLNEIDKEDVITILIGKETYKYKVYEKLVVLPTETSVLKGSKEQKILTLITCDPIYIASHRLILHAELIQ